MAAAQSEAERLRRCREMFERSNRDGVSMAEARDAIALERFQAIIQRRGSQCGTRAPAVPSDDVGQTPPRWMMAE